MYQQLSRFSFYVPQMIFECVSWWSLSSVRKQKYGIDNNAGCQERGEIGFHPPQLCRLMWAWNSVPLKLPYKLLGFSTQWLEKHTKGIGRRPGGGHSSSSGVGAEPLQAGCPMGLTPHWTPPAFAPLVNLITWSAEVRWSFLVISRWWEEQWYVHWVLPSLTFQPSFV